MTEFVEQAFELVARAIEDGTVFPPLAGVLTGMAIDRALRVPVIAMAAALGGLGGAAWMVLEPDDWAAMRDAYGVAASRLSSAGFFSGMLGGKLLAAVLGGLRAARR